MTEITEQRAVDSVSHWQGKYYRGEITLEECALVCNLMIFRERITLADEIISWGGAVLVAGGIVWLTLNL